MKKQLLIALIISFATSLTSPCTLKAQVNKKNKKTVQHKPTVNPEELIKTKAEGWFKSVYVDKFFKDPYSYKLLKISSEKISTKQSLLDSITYLTAEIEKCKLPQAERNEQSRKEYQTLYDEILLDIKKEEENLKNSKDSKQNEYIVKRIGIHKKYGLIYLERMKDYDIFRLNTKEKSRIQEKLLTLTPQQESELAFHLVKIDCYSKNSIGNEVLGRFQFPFTEMGPIGYGNGTNTVIHLNKE